MLSEHNEDWSHRGGRIRQARTVFQLLPKTGHQREGMEMKYSDYLSSSPFILCQCFPLAEPNQNPEKQQFPGISLLRHKAGQRREELAGRANREELA